MYACAHSGPGRPGPGFITGFFRTNACGRILACTHLSVSGPGRHGPALIKIVENLQVTTCSDLILSYYNMKHRYLP
jgi:hypothetical protein